METRDEPAGSGPERSPDLGPSDRDDLVEEDGRLVIPASGVTITDTMVTAWRDADQR